MLTVISCHIVAGEVRTEISCPPKSQSIFLRRRIKKKLKIEGQTYCALCDYKSRSIGSLKQHMESKHNLFNMTIVQVLTQQVERINDMESEIKSKEKLIKKTEVDLNVSKVALKTEK